MENLIDTLIDKKDRKDFKEFVSFLTNQSHRILLRNEIIRLFRQYCDQRNKTREFCKNSSPFNFFKKIQEALITDDYLVLIHRYVMAKYRFYLVRLDGEYIEEISLPDYLDLKDYYATQRKVENNHLHLDFMPFYDFSPSIRDIHSVGNGIRFLNRYMCSNIFSRPNEWNSKLFEFIKLHQYNGRQLLINGTLIKDIDSFYHEIEQLLEWLRRTTS